MSMDRLYKDTIPHFGNGSSQNGRTLPALLPDYAKIDQRSLADLLAFSARYARLVNHYNEKNEVSGSWESFFTTDISVILATIISTDLASLEKAHQRLVEEVSQSFQEMEKYGQLREIFVQIHQMATEVNTWFEQVSRINLTYQGIENEVANELHNIIETKLRGQLQSLMAYDSGAGEKQALGGPMGLSYDHFDPLWEAEIESIQSVNIYKGGTLLEKLDAALVQLRLLFRGFFNVLSYMVYNFARYFDASLLEKSNHKPDIALFIVFLKLFRHAQHDLNYVSARHLELYYDHFLLQKRRQAISDQAYVCFQLSDHVNAHFLPANTQLRAGRRPDGSEIIYRTDQDILLNRARITALKTLYMSQFELSEIGTYQLVTGMYAAQQANSLDGDGTPFPGPNMEWPTFGEEQLDKIKSMRTMGAADIGLAIASPMFFLQEGKREIKVRFEFEDGSANIYRKLIKDLAAYRGVREEEAFHIAFPGRDQDTKNLSVFYTTSSGWQEIPPFQLKVLSPEKWSAYELTIEIALPPSAPSWVGYDAALYEGEKGYPTRYPLLKVLLNHRIEPFPYTFLKDPKVSTIDIEVAVDRVRQVRLFNELGQLNGNQPFQPFGSLPSVGSYLMVGNAEVFRKPLTELAFHYEWQNVPATDIAFQKYYAGYEDGEPLDIKSHDFQIGMSALSQNTFSPDPEASRQIIHKLFNSISTNSAGPQEIGKCKIELEPHELIALDVHPDPRLEELSPYSNQTASGYFRLELLDPPHAFGHQLYQSLFGEVVTHNANPDHKAHQRAIPNQPYTPTLKSIHLSYKANTTINLSNKGDRSIPEQVFHIHPFGLENIYSRGEPRLKANEERLNLLPQYHHNGYLYIGLEGLKPPQPISLLFQLTTSKYKGSTRFQVPEVRWSYLSKNQWKPFKVDQHLSDTTYDFTQKGIVQLMIPADIGNRNDIFPSRMHWLRVAVSGDTEVLCHAIDVKAQAVKVVWEQDASPERLAEPLPAQSINALVQGQSEIASLEQPFPSFGGSPVESDREYFGRVSERLRHKGRGVSHWDLERLTLSWFHTLKQVKCLSHLSHPDFFSTEDGVTVVVVPGKNDSPEALTPKVNYKTLSDIEQYLSGQVSPFTDLKVRNPQYEYLRVYCKIKFVDGKNNGETLNQLGEDLQDFLCPWIKDASKDLRIGVSISEEVHPQFHQRLAIRGFCNPLFHPAHCQK